MQPACCLHIAMPIWGWRARRQHHGGQQNAEQKRRSLPSAGCLPTCCSHSRSIIRACAILMRPCLASLCSLYLAHLERTQLAGILDGPLPLPCAPPGDAAGAAGPAGQDSVVLLTGGNAAALSPATVLSVGGGEDGRVSSSRGLLSELARAADSWMTPAQQAQHCPPSSTAGGRPKTTNPASAERGSQQRSGPGSAGNGSSGRQPAGDLLLLPAGASPAGRVAAAAAAAVASIGGGAASPTAGACGGDQVGAAARGHAPPSPQSTAGPCPGTQQAQQQAQQLGCSRLALHAGSLLLRLVDDFLLITAVPAVAQGFATRMLAGVWAGGRVDRRRGVALCCAGCQGSESTPRGTCTCLPLRPPPACQQTLCCTATKALPHALPTRPPAGFESHSVFVNPEKTKLSFALQLPAAGPAGPFPGRPAARAAAPAAGAAAGATMPASAARGAEVVPATVWRSADGATFIKWCGLLVNTATLELQADYTRWPHPLPGPAGCSPARSRTQTVR